jgi:MFS family permease
MELNAGHDYTYKQYARRWRMLGIVFFCTFLIQFIFITYAPIATPASVFYNVDTTAINWLALVWPLLFLPCTIASGWSLHKYGLRPNMIIAGFMMLLGTGVRLISVAIKEQDATIKESYSTDDSVTEIEILGQQKASRAAYSFVLIGTIIVATVQPIVLSSTTQLASAWFAEDQRSLANTLVRP